MQVRIGIDLGGTKTEAIALDGSGAVIERRRIATPANSYEAIIESIAGLVKQIESSHGENALIGIGMPGSISPATGLVRNANTVCLIGRPFQQDVQAALQRPVRIENDANCLLLSEMVGGCAVGAASVFGVIIGTGTGGALGVDGKLLSGVNAVAGEWGHNPVPWTVAPELARPCYCGQQNCVETFLSGAGLLRTFHDAGGTRVERVEALVEAAQSGNAKAVATLSEYAQQLAACVAVVINIFDPELVVLAGGLSNLPRLVAGTSEALPAYVFSDAVATQIRIAQHGDSSGVFGAANLWRV